MLAEISTEADNHSIMGGDAATGLVAALAFRKIKPPPATTVIAAKEAVKDPRPMAPPVSLLPSPYFRG